ncbi:MAG: hypothetical protein WCL60_06325 [Methylococcales bacterium]
MDSLLGSRLLMLSMTAFSMGRLHCPRNQIIQADRVLLGLDLTELYTAFLIVVAAIKLSAASRVEAALISL